MPRPTPAKKLTRRTQRLCLWGHRPGDLVLHRCEGQRLFRHGPKLSLWPGFIAGVELQRDVYWLALDRRDPLHQRIMRTPHNADRRP